MLHARLALGTVASLLYPRVWFSEYFLSRREVYLLCVLVETTKHAEDEGRWVDSTEIHLEKDKSSDPEGGTFQAGNSM